MDATYRSSPRFVSGDPYQALAALALTTSIERDDRRPARRRRSKRNLFHPGVIGSGVDLAVLSYQVAADHREQFEHACGPGPERGAACSP